MSLVLNPARTSRRPARARAGLPSARGRHAWPELELESGVGLFRGALIALLAGALLWALFGALAYGAFVLVSG